MLKTDGCLGAGNGEFAPLVDDIEFETPTLMLYILFFGD